jgi:23S rRNA (cytidine1920-2'-O)/16S rRNA (cytidine1409-2'-O)-methyltransferase
LAKERIDTILARLGLAPSREKARVLIMAGEVYIGSERVTKPDMKVAGDAPIEVRGDPIPYVSYGGIKLEAALDRFGIDVTGFTALDVGSSTGGFVDCLLAHGVRKVHAIDVGTHQLHEKLRKDERVVLRENLNARTLTLEDIGELVDVVTIDVSFISLRKILPPVVSLIKPGGCIMSLFKPQFEVGRFEVGKGGIVKDQEKISRVMEEIKAFGLSIGVEAKDSIEVPRDRKKKNKEYFILWEIRTSPNQ